MNSLILTQDAVSTMTTLLKASGNYVQKRIPNKKDRTAYIKAMNKCLATISDSSTLDQLQGLVIACKADKDRIYSRRNLFDFGQETTYHDMACDQALEAIQSVFTRFVSGGADPAPRFARTIIFYDGTEVF